MLSALAVLILTAMSACESTADRHARIDAARAERELAKEQRRQKSLAKLRERAQIEGVAWEKGFRGKGTGDGDHFMTGYALTSVSQDELETTACRHPAIGKFKSLTISDLDSDGLRTVEARCSGGFIAAMAGRGDKNSFPNSGMTYLSYSPPGGGIIRGHGFQVAYLADNGREYLWYPRNARVVAADWKLEGDNICYRYSSNTYNPVTKKKGGEFECRLAKIGSYSVVAELDGDPFDLATGNVPYRLNPCNAPEEFEFDREEFKC